MTLSMCPGDTDFCPHHGCTTCQGRIFYFKDPDERRGFVDERNHDVWDLIVERHGSKMSVNGAYDDGFEPAPRPGAVLCWPVEFPFQTNPVEEAHCTLMYWPEVEVEKEKLLEVLRWNPVKNFYRLAEVTGVDVFGEFSDYPVLKIRSNIDGQPQRHTLEGVYDFLVGCIYSHNIQMCDTRFTYNPHVSVDIKTLVNPPKTLILRPMELWYKDDEPVRL